MTPRVYGGNLHCHSFSSAPVRAAGNPCNSHGALDYFSKKAEEVVQEQHGGEDIALFPASLKTPRLIIWHRKFLSNYEIEYSLILKIPKVEGSSLCILPIKQYTK